jgi:hypothetical protein
MKADYSEKEFKMIQACSPHWADIVERNVDSEVFPVKILELVGMECFIENKTGKAVDSLRRCLKAMRDCSPYRETPEYEALIELD